MKLKKLKKLSCLCCGLNRASVDLDEPYKINLATNESDDMKVKVLYTIKWKYDEQLGSKVNDDETVSIPLRDHNRLENEYFSECDIYGMPYYGENILGLFKIIGTPKSTKTNNFYIKWIGTVRTPLTEFFKRVTGSYACGDMLRFDVLMARNITREYLVITGKANSGAYKSEPDDRPTRSTPITRQPVSRNNSIGSKGSSKSNTGRRDNSLNRYKSHSIDSQNWNKMSTRSIESTSFRRSELTTKAIMHTNQNDTNHCYNYSINTNPNDIKITKQRENMSRKYNTSVDSLHAGLQRTFESSSVTVFIINERCMETNESTEVLRFRLLLSRDRYYFDDYSNSYLSGFNNNTRKLGKLAEIHNIDVTANTNIKITYRIIENANADIKFSLDSNEITKIDTDRSDNYVFIVTSSELVNDILKAATKNMKRANESDLIEQERRRSEIRMNNAISTKRIGTNLTEREINIDGNTNSSLGSSIVRPQLRQTFHTCNTAAYNTASSIGCADMGSSKFKSTSQVHSVTSGTVMVKYKMSNSPTISLKIDKVLPSKFTIPAEGKSSRKTHLDEVDQYSRPNETQTRLNKNVSYRQSLKDDKMTRRRGSDQSDMETTYFTSTNSGLIDDSKGLRNDKRSRSTSSSRVQLSFTSSTDTDSYYFGKSDRGHDESFKRDSVAESSLSKTVSDFNATSADVDEPFKQGSVTTIRNNGAVKIEKSKRSSRHGSNADLNSSRQQNDDFFKGSKQDDLSNFQGLHKNGYEETDKNSHINSTDSFYFEHLNAKGLATDKNNGNTEVDISINYATKTKGSNKCQEDACKDIFLTDNYEKFKDNPENKEKLSKYHDAKLSKTTSIPDRSDSSRCHAPGIGQNSPPVGLYEDTEKKRAENSKEQIYKEKDTDLKAKTAGKHQRTASYSEGDQGSSPSKLRRISDVKTRDVKTSDVKTGNVKTDDVKTSDFKTGDAKTGEVKTGEVKTGEVKTGEMKTDELKTGEVKTGDDKTGDVMDKRIQKQKLKKQEEYSMDSSFHSQSYSTRNERNSGLQNIGNTCYMNSVLQCLTIVRWELLKNDMNGSHAFVRDFIRLMIDMTTGNSKAIAPYDLKSSFHSYNTRFSTSNQQDSHEFLTFILYTLRENLSEAGKKFLIENFRGRLDNVTHVKCPRNHDIIASQDLYTISLPVKFKGPKTVEASIAKFIEDEDLDEEDKVRCKQCKDKFCCSLQMCFGKLPPILVLHLKKFDFVTRQKLDVDLKFPFEDLRVPEMNEMGRFERVYDLYGVCNHYGSLSSGHYTAFVKSQISGEWYKYNDSSVYQVPKDEVRRSSSSAYLLFYKLVESSIDSGDYNRTDL